MSAEKPAPLPLRRPPGYRDPNTQIRQHERPLKRQRCRICCCCLCIVVVILILAGLTLYLWFQPRLPQFRLKSVAFSNLNISTAPDGVPVLDAASTLTIEIRNPNRILGVVYERSRVAMSAVNGDVGLGERQVAGFSQERDGVTTLKLAMKVEREIVDGRSAHELRKGFQTRNLVLNAVIRSGIGVKHGRWATAPLDLVVVCAGVRLSAVGASITKCRIKMFNWVFIN